MPTTGRVRLGNLGPELTSFIGRRGESAEVRHLQAESRLVTLTGSGGVGKTRLAMRVAAEAHRAFPAGVWLIDLTELHEAGPGRAGHDDEGTLAYLVAATLGLPERGSEPPLRQLTGQLTDRCTLLVLDNCEHFLRGCAAFAATVLRACPQVRILVTSREPLAVAGERCYSVPPLSAPQPDQPLADVCRHDSVALFVDRAQATAPTFQMTEENWPAVAELCRRLDGLPLAIELAAPLTVVLSPGQILRRLTDRFALLGRGSHTAPRRQRTLQACLDWSFELCTTPEQVLWMRLSVFVAGFDLDAIEGVCADATLPEANLLALVTGLIDKSVLVRFDVDDHSDAPARYRMLETIREYGRAKLAAAGQCMELRRRHGQWYAAMVDRAAAEWISDRQESWYAQLTREHSNVRAAIDYYLAEPDQAETAMRIAVTVPSAHWWRRGLFRESRQWLDRTLDQTGAPTALRAQALLLDAHLTLIQGDTEAGMRLLEEGERLTRSLVHATVEPALAAFVRGVIALYGDDLPAAVTGFEQVLAILAASPCPSTGREMELRLSGLIMLAVAAAMAGNSERADDCYRAVLAITESLGERHYQSTARWPLALSAWRRGNAEEATSQLTNTLRLKRGPAAVDQFGAAQCLEGLAWIAAGQQRHRRAATLLGAADARWTDSGLAVSGFQHLIGCHDACEQQARGALGDAAFGEAVQAGQALSYADAIAFALDEGRRLATPPAGKPAPLTRREQQVAELVGQGLSNKEIAVALVVSRRTAESHVERILTKLNLGNRTQVAAWVTTPRPARRSL